jgi:hypothetical protein
MSGNVRRRVGRIGLVVFSMAAWLCASSRLASAQGLNAKAPACGLLPIADLEVQYGAKASVPGGLQLPGQADSTCGVNLARTTIKLQAAPPGTEGVPTSIQMGLAGAMLLSGDAGKDHMWSKPETKDLGNVGCIKVSMQQGFGGKPLATPIPSATCFLVQGGYLNLTIASEDGKDVSFDVVRRLLEKAAARRKTL